MDKRKTVKDIAIVTASNIVAILAGIVTGFIIPKIFSVEEYGYYKTFTLYSSYMGLLNLGIADGIVLKYGGYNYSELTREKFRTYFKWFMVVHLILCGGMILCGLFLKGETGFILIMLGVNTIIVNAVGYFQQISQITQRFKEFSMRKIIQAGSGIVVVCIILAINYYQGSSNYHLYLIISILFSVALSIWYFITYKEIIFGKAIPFRSGWKEIEGFIQSGFPLLFANLCSTLILTLDRQFVNLLFDKTEYAVYAFAYSMLSLVTVATSAVSTVLFPTLKRTSKDNLHNSYTKLVGIMLVFVFGAMIGYYPLHIFINWFLPKYNGSLIIFRIIFPGLAISSCVTVIMHNYYKVLDINLLYFKKSIVVLIISALANAIAYFVFKTTASISVASIITMLIWYLYVENTFVKEYKINTKGNLMYMFLMGGSFYLLILIPNVILSLALYLIVYFLTTYFAMKDILREIRTFVRTRKRV